MTKSSKWQQWLMVILLAIGGGTIFKSLYLREVFYYPWNEFMGVNNTDSGLLMSWLGLVGIIAGAVAGVIIDKINNNRLVISLTFIGVAVFTFWQSTAPSLPLQYLIIGVISFLANGFFLVSMVRATRLIGESKDQGKMFGFLESGRGIAGSIISGLAVAFFATANTDAEGVGRVLVGYSVLYLLIGALMWFVMPKNDKRDATAEVKQKVTGKDVWAVLRTPQMWLAAFSIFATISFYQGASYLVPYLTDAYGMSTAAAGLVGMIRAYVLAILLAPIAGILADRVGSAIKVMNWLFILGAIGVALFLLIPQDPAMVWLLVGALVVVGSVNFALRGVMYAQIDEIKVPAHLTGTVMGFMATVGFSPEMFIPTLFGYWLDTFKMQGYTYMFIFMAATFALAVLTTWILYRTRRKAFQSYPEAAPAVATTQEN